MSQDAGPGEPLPETVLQTLDDFRERLSLDIHVWQRDDDRAALHVYPPGAPPPEPLGEGRQAARSRISPRDGPPLELEIRRPADDTVRAIADVLASAVERTYDAAQEIRFFTYELSERYEEINLLYSISETLGSILELDEAARNILHEVCDVLGARRGSLWVYESGTDVLKLVAFVGASGLSGPLWTDDPSAVTALVFREGRPVITSRKAPPGDASLTQTEADDSFLSVPIRYTPPTGEPRTVGVLNLIGRRRGGRFTASDQKLLSAIASQVGAALENNRLIHESLRQERVAQEMALAHNLQMKLLPAVESFSAADVAARVEPAVSVGGDFYRLFELPEGRIGVMIGDVSSHGFPAALIMALSMSAASIYGAADETPGEVLGRLDDALREELENTEMYLSMFYGVLDPAERRLVYSNAGHPHAFLIRGNEWERLAATDPPMGIAGADRYGERSSSWDPEADLLLLFTDGLSDTLATGSRGSGETLILDEVIRRRDERPSAIVNALFALAREATPTIPSDDRTAVVLKA